MNRGEFLTVSFVRDHEGEYGALTDAGGGAPSHDLSIKNHENKVKTLSNGVFLSERNHDNQRGIGRRDFVFMIGGLASLGLYTRRSGEMTYDSKDTTNKLVIDPDSLGQCPEKERKIILQAATRASKTAQGYKLSADCVPLIYIVSPEKFFSIFKRFLSSEDIEKVERAAAFTFQNKIYVKPFGHMLLNELAYRYGNETKVVEEWMISGLLHELWHINNPEAKSDKHDVPYDLQSRYLLLCAQGYQGTAKTRLTQYAANFAKQAQKCREDTKRVSIKHIL